MHARICDVFGGMRRCHSTCVEIKDQPQVNCPTLFEAGSSLLDTRLAEPISFQGSLSPPSISPEEDKDYRSTLLHLVIYLSVGFFFKQGFWKFELRSIHFQGKCFRN